MTLPNYLILAVTPCADDGTHYDKLFYTDKRAFINKQSELRSELITFAAFTLTHVASNGAL